MKFKTLLTMAAIITSSNCAFAQRPWLADYGIDPSNPCPVFTKPPRTGPNRTEGAGICTNDGAAYNCTFYTLGEDWHYEPKLNLCDQEKAVMSRITGQLQHRIILKFGINPLRGGGALVTYRIFGFDSAAPSEHYLATYNNQGQLLDAIALGNRESLNEVLHAEPHGSYTPRVNMGGSHWKVDTATQTITLTRYYYYDNPIAPNSDKWEDTLVYHITPQGHFELKSHDSKGKPAVNAQAEQLMALSMLPLSTTDVMAQWNDLTDQCKGNSELYGQLLPHVAELFVKRPQEFIMWTTQHQRQSVLIAALRQALDTNEWLADGMRIHIAKSVEACTDADAQKYWQHLRPF